MGFRLLLQLFPPSASEMKKKKKRRKDGEGKKVNRSKKKKRDEILCPPVRLIWANAHLAYDIPCAEWIGQVFPNPPELSPFVYHTKQKELHVSMGLLPGINAAPNKSPPFGPKYHPSTAMQATVTVGSDGCCTRTWLGFRKTQLLDTKKIAAKIAIGMDSRDIHPIFPGPNVAP